MKKVLLPLAFLGLTIGGSVSMANDAGFPHNNTQSVWVDNSHQRRDVLVFVVNPTNCRDNDAVKVKGGRHRHIKICDNKPFQIQVCFAEGRSDDDLQGDRDRQCSSERTACAPDNSSPGHVVVLGDAMPVPQDSITGDRRGPNLFCYGRQK